ncbi:hypothetical protein AB0L05_21700 [Nonomuraea pusilla]|uniref:hypothetical protein n=1 Tax=Nonomuraea pusilla TaxID=46177 RepID=UPI00331A774A
MTLPSGSSVPMPVRYDDVRAALSSPAASRVFGEDDPTTVRGMTIERIPGVIINTDPPEHDRLRRILQGAFSLRRTEKWRPAVAAVVHDLLDGLGDPFDLVEEYALALSARVMCRVLGVPPEDYDRFGGWGETFLSTSTSSAEARGLAWAALVEYAAGLVRRSIFGGATNVPLPGTRCRRPSETSVGLLTAG